MVNRLKNITIPMASNTLGDFVKALDAFCEENPKEAKAALIGIHMVQKHSKTEPSTYALNAVIKIGEDEHL